MEETEKRELSQRLLLLSDEFREQVTVLVNLHKNRAIAEINRDLAKAQVHIAEATKDGRINGTNAEIRAAQLTVLLSDDKEHQKWSLEHIVNEARYKEAELTLVAVRLESRNLRVLLGGRDDEGP